MSHFKIPAIPKTTQKCIRFPNDVIDQVEEIITQRECSFAAFVIESVRFALKDLEDSKR